MINLIANLSNAYTLIDLILIIGFATSTLVLYRKNQKLKSMYYNTTQVKGQTLIDFTNKADSQEEAIMNMFKKTAEFTPSQAWNSFKAMGVPITSIRRAMTRLKNEGLIIKTDKKQAGIFGRPETIYRLRTA